MWAQAIDNDPFFRLCRILPHIKIKVDGWQQISSNDTSFKTGSRFLIYKLNRDTFMNTENQIIKNDDENPFKDMGFIQFWIVSTLFWMTFPASVAICYLTIGLVRTKQLVKALVNDFLQTLLVILIVVCIVIYVIYHYVSAWF